ncbi:protein adenylyltransferase SelO [Anatilimnocola floriformis]|uniref:protein adenylyltransferase SelO n=1 Tax=Anatilimnocola floriformis TaxID=2948575 RepID=UPI0020C2FB61|nr:YdiU family protein [Anatilimnocola floriformis]
MSTLIPPAANSDLGWQIEHTYAQLPATLFAASRPVPVRDPHVSILNHRLAERLGLNLAGATPETLATLFAGNQLPSNFQPIAQAYAGHQFGGFTMLGDGRAILLCEHRTPAGDLVDIQLKGAGRTKFSRGGDGRAALGPMLREYVISEAMVALGIPTTQSLAVVTTGEPVYRQLVRKGAILVRVAASHIRVGTFQYVAATRDQASLQLLADYAIQRHYPEIANTPDKYREFLRAVIDRQASLIAKWQAVGFIHGVMNTDNMAISGETIDYGPCAFMNSYDPGTVFSSIDHAGRYAYGNQPQIAIWNLARFAETLLPLFATDSDQAIAIATEILRESPAVFERHWLAAMRRKLGLQTQEADDLELLQSLLDWMQQTGADYTNTWRDLSMGVMPTGENYSEPAFAELYAQWQERLSRETEPRAAIYAAMQSVNPAYIPRNHRVEEALTAAEESDDLLPLQRLLEVLQHPFDEVAASAPYREPPPESECNYQTFCGT